MGKYSSLPPSGRDGTDIRSIKTMLTIATFIFGLPVFGVAFSLLIADNVFHAYFPEWAGSIYIGKLFSLPVQTALWRFENERESYSFFLFCLGTEEEVSSVIYD